MDMQMKDFDFNNLKVVTKKCLYISDNKAIVRNKKLYCVADINDNQEFKNLYVEECLKDSVDYQKEAWMFVDLDVVCFFANYTMNGWGIIKDIEWKLKHLTNITLDMVLDNVHKRKLNNQFVNVADIKLIELSGVNSQEVQDLIDYRQAWYNKKHKEEQERELERQQKDIEFVNEKNKIVKDLVLNAEQKIINKQEVKNEDITIFKSRYDCSDTSLILYMMKRYEIKVPLKTQGWINKALVNIYYHEEWKQYSYRYLKTSAYSQVFCKYLNQLVDKVREKYNYKEDVVTDAEMDYLFGIV